jgi:hypothetical protein
MVVDRARAARRKSPIYRCGIAMIGTDCPGAYIATSVIDSAVWGKVVSLIQDPSQVEDEVRRMKSQDPMAQDLEAVERAIQGLEGQHRNLTGNLKTAKPGRRTRGIETSSWPVSRIGSWPRTGWMI